MENNQLATEDSPPDRIKLRGAIVTVTVSALAFLAIEFEFISSLIHLIGVHAKSGYIWPALAFQIFLVTSLMKYLRFWQTLREMRASAKEKEKLATDISSLVFFLLLSLFVFSSVTVFFAKVN
jgi:hypothetical protein